MKKIYASILTTLFYTAAKASWTITIFGTSYSPPTLTVNPGEVITIQASASHSLAEVSATTWGVNGTTPLGGGFGVKTANYTFTASTLGTIYYVCQNHVASMGMKGTITVVAPTGLTSQSLLNQNIVLFPNPVKNEIKFTIPSSILNVDLKLTSITGLQINVGTHNNVTTLGEYATHTLFLQDAIANGIYLLEITSGKEKLYKKLVITN